MTVIESSNTLRASAPVFFHEQEMRARTRYKNLTMDRLSAALSLPPPGRRERRTCTKSPGSSFGPKASRQVIADMVSGVHELAREAVKSATSTFASPAKVPGQADSRAKGATEPARRSKIVRLDQQRARADVARANDLYRHMRTSEPPSASTTPPADASAAQSDATVRAATPCQVIQGEVVQSVGTLPIGCPVLDPNLNPTLPAQVPRVENTTSASLNALVSAGSASQRAASVGVDVAKSPFLRRLLQVGNVGLSVIDLVAAVGLALVSGLTCRSVAIMAAHQLKDAVDDLRKPLAQQPVPVPGAAGKPATGEVEPATRIQSSALTRIGEARECMQRAQREADVDLARSAFLNRLIGVGVASLALGLSIAATVVTGGLGGVALLLSVLLLRQALANANCAWQNKLAVENGQPQMPMGSSALANAMYKHFSGEGLGKDEAKWEAAKVAAMTSTIVAGVGVALGATTTIVLPLAIKCLRVVCSFTAALVLPSVDHLRGGAVKANVREYQKYLEREVVEHWLKSWMLQKDEARQRLVEQFGLGAVPAKSVEDEARALATELQRWELRTPATRAQAQKLMDEYGVDTLRSDPQKYAQDQNQRVKSETLSAYNWAVPTWMSASGTLINALI